MKKPYISSEYKLLFKPQIHGCYVNDHCIVKKGDEFHLFGITSHTPGAYNERYFVHAVSDDINKEFREVGKSVDRGTLAWSPCVTERDGHFYMIYGPSPTQLAISPDMYEWFGYLLTIKNEPPMAFHRDHFVLEIDDGYLMYVSGIKDKRGSVAVAYSKDLINWEFKGYALTTGKNSPLQPGWGAMESPYVVKYDNLYYMFITYTDCADDNYNDTLVFVSENPCDFGCYMDDDNPAVPIAKVYAHAPEILNVDGKYYITTCGWPNKPNPNPGCVSIAELKWE